MPKQQDGATLHRNAIPLLKMYLLVYLALFMGEKENSNPADQLL